ncbi:cytochrome b5 [Ceratobasidium sp. AG-Ba]|nr:cytochrome b5 [Ceratobasidium sp. AG-Ba]QRW12198.1 cytochrome b5 [Ceratobasidium sp. AG-Ba]
MMNSNPPEPLAPPKDDPYTLDQLKAFDGSDPSKPLYLAVKGTVFDVSAKRDMYGPGGSYALLAGKDASVALGKSSLKEEDATPDWSTLEPSEKQTLDQWHGFFTKKYSIVGKVSDLPEAVRDAS